MVTGDEKQLDIGWNTGQRHDEPISADDYQEYDVGGMSHLADLQQQQQQEYSAPHYGKGTEYCNKRVCVCVCVCACLYVCERISIVHGSS